MDKLCMSHNLMVSKQKDYKMKFNTLSKQKVSEMLLKVGDGFIQMAENLEQKENYLRSVCTAWNISCLDEGQREKILFDTVTHFKNINKSTDENAKHYEETLRKLIEVKLKLYPRVKLQILSAEITEVNGKDKVVAISKKM